LAALLSNHVSELAIAQWGGAQSEEVKKALGFQKGLTPHQSTIQRLFRRVSAEEVEAAFRSIFLPMLKQDQEQRGACALAIDGKAQRGRLKFEEEASYPVHAVSMVEQETGIVLTQGHVERPDTQTKSESREPEAKSEPADKQNRKKGRTKTQQSEPTEEKEKQEQEDKKQRSELAVASRLIAHIDWEGKILTGDAFYCQRCWCSALRRAGGD